MANPISEWRKTFSWNTPCAGAGPTGRPSSRLSISASLGAREGVSIQIA
jgi:hypothetical protein